MKRINTKFLVLGVALVLVCIEVAFAQYRASNTLGVQSVAAGVPSAGGLVPEITPQTAAATPIAAGTVVLPSGVTALRPAFLSDSATTIGCGPLTGLPGIHPTIAGAGPAQPAFTVADVMAYHAANHATGLGDLPCFSLPPLASPRI